MEEKLGFEVRHFLDSRPSDQGIRDRITEWIRDADVCIADLTDNRPNVHFEYGLRLATSLTVIPIVDRQWKRKLIYDVDNYPTIVYDINDPEPAQRRIKESVEHARLTGFNRGRLETKSVRHKQSQAVYDYIESHEPERIDILQCSLLAAQDIFHSFWKCPKALIRLLLMHPQRAAKYGTRTLFEHVEGSIREISETAKKECIPCPNIGLWYYDHEPSVAAIIVDDDLIQLGWYLCSPRPGTSKLLLKGHDQPGVLAIGREAKYLVEPFKKYFEAVFRAAEPADPNWKLCIGPRKRELKALWDHREDPPAIRPG